MANASLQIGNGNWAIKEDNLLGYSKSGTRFLPIPITMTRATLGTRVNPSGLIENVELLDDELVTNGDFATDSDWSKGSNWTISGGSATSDGVNATSNLSQVITSFSGKTFLVEGNASNVSQGFAYVSLGGSDLQIVVNSSGAFKHYVTISSGNSTLFISGRNNFIGSIDNVSVKEVTRDGLARVDYTDGTGSLLVEPQRTNLITYSESISNLSSTTNGTGTLTITDNYTDSPQGLQNASRVQMSIVDTNDTNNYRLINAGSVMITGVTREISFYAKSLTGSNQDVLVYWSYDQQIVTLTNDWQIFKISATSGNSGSVFIGTRGGSGDYFSGGDANLDFALWGLQVEDDGSGGGSSYATSYIKTQGSTVTRNQDEYTKTGISDKINSDEGVLFLEMAALSDDNTDRRISLNDGSSSNEIRIGYSRFTGNIISEIISGGSVQNVNWGATGVTQTNNNKFALSWGSGTMKFYVNGLQTNIETGITSPTGLNTLKFSLGNDTLNLLAKVKQLQVFKTALSDSELATLTTI